ncbi:MAG: glycoside hydrolase family 18 protein, partial [Gemmatimonadaceae bacterium]
MSFEHTRAAARAQTRRLLLAALVGAGARAACKGADAGTPEEPITETPPPSTRWVAGYWVGYQRDLYPETEVDFSLLTHVMVGAINPTPSGGVTRDLFIDNTTGPQVARTLATRAHQAGRKAILMLGGAGQHDNLASAASPANRATFVANLLTTMDDLGYDGIDVDWEPIETADRPALLALVQALRAARPGMILTVPVYFTNANFPGDVDGWYAQLAAPLDQLNIMSYDMADNWGGWVSWHTSALQAEGADHPTSVASSVRAYRDAGVPAAKIGIGIPFYGACWRGPTAPLQPLGSTAGVVAGDNVMSYPNLLATYFDAAAYHWDDAAKMPYLGFTSPRGPQRCTFISYDDPQSIAAKGAYVKTQGLGGAIVWT